MLVISVLFRVVDVGGWVVVGGIAQHVGLVAEECESENLQVASANRRDDAIRKQNNC